MDLDYYIYKLHVINVKTHSIETGPIIESYAAEQMLDRHVKCNLFALESVL